MRAYGSATGVEKSTRRPSRKPPVGHSRPATGSAGGTTHAHHASAFDPRECQARRWCARSVIRRHSPGLLGGLPTGQTPNTTRAQLPAASAPGTRSFPSTCTPGSRIAGSLGAYVVAVHGKSLSLASARSAPRSSPSRRASGRTGDSASPARSPSANATDDRFSSASFPPASGRPRATRPREDELLTKGPWVSRQPSAAVWGRPRRSLGRGLLVLRCLAVVEMQTRPMRLQARPAPGSSFGSSPKCSHTHSSAPGTFQRVGLARAWTHDSRGRTLPPAVSPYPRVASRRAPRGAGGCRGAGRARSSSRPRC